MTEKDLDSLESAATTFGTVASRHALDLIAEVRALRRAVADSDRQLQDAVADRDVARRTVKGLAERVATQSEALTRRAMRFVGPPAGAILACRLCQREAPEATMVGDRCVHCWSEVTVCG